MVDKFQYRTGTGSYNKPANIPGNGRTERGQTKEQKEVRGMWIPHAKRQGGSREACEVPRPDLQKKRGKGQGGGLPYREEMGLAS